MLCAAQTFCVWDFLTGFVAFGGPCEVSLCDFMVFSCMIFVFNFILFGCYKISLMRVHAFWYTIILWDFMHFGPLRDFLIWGVMLSGPDEISWDFLILFHAFLSPNEISLWDFYALCCILFWLPCQIDFLSWKIFWWDFIFFWQLKDFLMRCRAFWPLRDFLVQFFAVSCIIVS